MRTKTRDPRWSVRAGVAVAVLVIAAVGCVDAELEAPTDGRSHENPNPWIPACRACLGWQTPDEAYFFHLQGPPNTLAPADGVDEAPPLPSVAFAFEGLLLERPPVELWRRDATPYGFGEFSGRAWKLERPDKKELEPGLDEDSREEARPVEPVRVEKATGWFGEATCRISVVQADVPPTLALVRAWAEDPSIAVVWCDVEEVEAVDE